MAADRNDLLPGTLELLVLKALSLEPMHGWGIGQRIDQLSKDVFRVAQGSLYPGLQRMLRKGWIRAEWRTSANNRRARYYSLTRAGRRQLETEASDWRRASETINAILRVRLAAATAVFIVVNRILLAGLPYPDPERLVRICQQYSPTNRGTISVVDILAIRDQQRSFAAFGAVRLAGVSIVGARGPERVGA